MTLISVILVLLLEQWRPLSKRIPVAALIGRFAAMLTDRFNAGERHHGVIAWLLAVVPLLLVVWGLYAILYRIHPFLALALNVGVLYLTMGFRQASHFFTDIHQALNDGELDRARSILGQWRGRAAMALSREEISRVAVEQALIGAHTYVFAVIFWFALLPGPIGAILYRLAIALHSHWGLPASGEMGRELGRELGHQRGHQSGHFGWFARSVYRTLDWIPARLTAIGFAIVGDFEDAVYCWRAQAHAWAEWLTRAASGSVEFGVATTTAADPAELVPEQTDVYGIGDSSGIVLATGAGALGVRLGNPIRREDGGYDERPELGLGDEPDAHSLDLTIGLIWRALVLWLAMILIITIVHALG